MLSVLINIWTIQGGGIGKPDDGSELTAWFGEQAKLVCRLNVGVNGEGGVERLTRNGSAITA